MRLLSFLSPQWIAGIVLVAAQVLVSAWFYRAGETARGKEWAEAEVRRARDDLRTFEQRQAHDAMLNRRIADADRQYQAQKVVRAADVERVAQRVRELEGALAERERELAAGAPADPPGTADPSAGIARECSGALARLDAAYGELLDKARTLQTVAGGVCVTRP